MSYPTPFLLKIGVRAFRTRLKSCICNPFKLQSFPAVSLGAAVAQAVGAVTAKELPAFPGSGEPAVPFHEGLTRASEDERLVQLLRHICRHEQKAVDDTYKDHQFVVAAGERRGVYRGSAVGWVVDVRMSAKL